ncbi:MAG: hypothetical protein HRU06_16195 [Oceanospirillaceae bacterium]|nr:hypothetical protein [Oceanospirillaceae bacterium]
MLLIALPSAQAANIYISGDSPFSELHIDGEIVKHDYTRMINVINRHRDIPYMLSLNSKGGNVMESIRIGSFARKYLMRFESKKCNSACLFIMLGSMYRSESKTAEFGIHRPKFKREFFANLTAQEATNKYKSLRNIVEAYMLRMGAKQQLVDDMFAVPSNNMKFIKSKNMATLLNTQSEGYSEWIISKCGDDLNPKQHHDLMAFYKNRSLQGNSYFEYLDSKSTQYFHCELEVVRMEQVRLFNNDARFNVQQLGAN